MPRILLILLAIASSIAAADAEPPAGAAAAPATAPAAHPYFQANAKALVTADGKKADPARILSHKYLMIYCSAHWCPPCRAFTPEFVKYYAEHGGGKDFEVLFVSSDEDAPKMLAYMSEMQMPWVGLRFGSSRTGEIKKRFGGEGIPCLAVVDDKDEIVFHSYVDGTYVGPHRVLDQFTALMKR